MVVVHIWFTGSEGVGHASLAIGNQTYVSYWPGGSGADAKRDFKLKQSHEAKWISKFAVDVRLEAKPLDVSICIDQMNEHAMEAAFIDLKNRGPSYNMRTHNCATVIAYLLEVGSAKKPTFVPMMDVAGVLPPGVLRTVVKIATFGGQMKMWTPQSIREYAQELM